MASDLIRDVTRGKHTLDHHAGESLSRALGKSATWYPWNSKPFLETITLQKNLETFQ